MTIRTEVEQIIQKALETIGVPERSFTISLSEYEDRGDMATNVALAVAKEARLSPTVLGEQLRTALLATPYFERIDIVPPGFMNLFLKETFIQQFLVEKKEKVSHKKALFEYTDPNCFKLFHIGHLMSNTIGESLSRLYEESGHTVLRVCYPSDIGLNVAKGVWGAVECKEDRPDDDAPLKDKISFLGHAYAFGHAKYEEGGSYKEAIIAVNKAIYEGNVGEILDEYIKGRELSLQYFEHMYKRLGTNFDATIYESEVGERGVEIVKAHVGSVFEESEGATVYKGEQDGLHTRVFINSLGLPTYEAKDLGNYERKRELLPDADTYVVITANEQNEYFKVINTVEEKLHPDMKGKIVHIGHGMLRLPEGKMSSRTGNVITADDLINLVKDRLNHLVKDKRSDVSENLDDDIAIGAIKFSILRQSPGKDIIFSIDTSLSFEGDSGPYLQYTHARTVQLRKKGESVHLKPHLHEGIARERRLEVLLASYDDTIDVAYNNNGPHHIVEYLLTLARAFNALYAKQVIIDESNKEKSEVYLFYTEQVETTLKKGLHILGITAPEAM